jgi:hypothetical protein
MQRAEASGAHSVVVSLAVARKLPVRFPPEADVRRMADIRSLRHRSFHTNQGE